MKKIYVIVIIGLFFFSSCATLYVKRSAECCPRAIKDKNLVLNSAFIDSANNLIINFYAKPARKKKCNYYIEINLDSINDTIKNSTYNFFLLGKFSEIMLNKTYDEIKDTTYYTYLEENDCFIMIKRDDLKENQRKKQMNDNDVTSNIEAGIVEGLLYFDYFSEDNNKYRYRFGIERLKKNYAIYLYLLLPFAVVFDIVTFPIQIIIFYIIIANIEV